MNQDLDVFQLGKVEIVNDFPYVVIDRLNQVVDIWTANNDEDLVTKAGDRYTPTVEKQYRSTDVARWCGYIGRIGGGMTVKSAVNYCLCFSNKVEMLKKLESLGAIKVHSWDI